MKAKVKTIQEVIDILRDGDEIDKRYGENELRVACRRAVHGLK